MTDAAMGGSEFSKIYSEHKEMVWKLVSKYAIRQADREDIFQEVFLNVHKSLKGFRGGSSLRTWIYRIAVNTSINHIKKQSRYRRLQEILKVFGVIEPEDELDAQSGSDRSLLQPLDKLNPRQRAIFLLAEVEDKKLDEISEMLKIPVGTVKSTLHRAREIIKKEVRQNGGI